MSADPERQSLLAEAKPIPRVTINDMPWLPIPRTNSTQSTTSSSSKPRDQTFDLTIESGVTLAWKNLQVTTKPERKKLIDCGGGGAEPKLLLDNVSGIARPGELLAIMGSSGAGKSTLMNTLMYRETDGLKISGNWYVNGLTASPELMTSLCGYVQQDDLFIGSLTVKEALTFQAMVKMDQGIPLHERYEAVDQVIRQLGLTKSQDTMVGIPGRIKGISGGEKKRLAVACEVLTNPPFLFLDEPTSGLDSHMANNVVDSLVQLARMGRSVICTIHQPSSALFCKFDRLLLLAGGRTAFLGDTNQAHKFFARIGHPCPINFNPADHYLDTLSVQPNRELEAEILIQSVVTGFEDSEEGLEMRTYVDQEVNKHYTSIELKSVKTAMLKDMYRSSFAMQFRALLWRGWVGLLKDPKLVKMKLLQTLIMSLIFGCVYYGQVLDQPGIMNINGALFILIVNLSFGNLFPVIDVFCSEMPIFMREHFNGMYRVGAYFMAKQIVMLPIFLLYPILQVCIMYFMVGFYPDFLKFCLCLLINILMVQNVLGMGYLVSCMFSRVDLALVLTPVLTIPLLLVGGFYLNDESIPVYLIWIKYISWFHYSFEAMMINQWDQVTNITCTLPENQKNPSDYEIPCIKSGNTVLNQFGFHKENLWFDILAMVVCTLVLRILAYFCLLARTHRPRQNKSQEILIREERKISEMQPTIL